MASRTSARGFGGPKKRPARIAMGTASAPPANSVHLHPPIALLYAGTASRDRENRARGADLIAPWPRGQGELRRPKYWREAAFREHAANRWERGAT